MMGFLATPRFFLQSQNRTMVHLTSFFATRSDLRRVTIFTVNIDDTRRIGSSVD